MPSPVTLPGAARHASDVAPGLRAGPSEPVLALEALLVGSRIAVLSPHPGRLRAEIGAERFGFANTGDPDFAAAAARLHGLLFEAPAAVEASA